MGISGISLGSGSITPYFSFIFSKCLSLSNWSPYSSEDPANIILLSESLNRIASSTFWVPKQLVMNVPSGSLKLCGMYDCEAKWNIQSGRISWTADIILVRSVTSPLISLTSCKMPISVRRFGFCPSARRVTKPMTSFPESINRRAKYGPTKPEIPVIKTLRVANLITLEREYLFYYINYMQSKFWNCEPISNRKPFLNCKSLCWLKALY